MSCAAGSPLNSDVRCLAFVDLFELTETLVNGLHDAEVTALAISYPDRSLTFQLNIWVGNMEGPRERREEYRPATIELAGLEYCILDRPDPTYRYKTNTELTIDLLESDPAIELPGAGTAFRLWVEDWNGFAHIRAGEAKLTWNGPSVFRATRTSQAPGP